MSANWEPFCSGGNSISHQIALIDHRSNSDATELRPKSVEKERRITSRLSLKDRRASSTGKEIPP